MQAGRLVGIVGLALGALLVTSGAVHSFSSAAGAAASRPTYVALGDSFAAGPGIPEQAGGTCMRSSANYPALVADRLRAELVDVTCSGATTANVIDTAQDANPPQLTALGPGTDYVTLTIGNNDVGYTRSQILCGLTPTATCVDFAAADTALEHVEQDLVATIRAVRRAAPNARVALVAYPRTLPDGGAPCPPQNSLDPGASARLVDVGARLQQHLAAAAKRTKVIFVDTYRPAGHDVCSPEARRWIEGAAPESAALVWHPNERGMQAQAAMVVRAFRQQGSR